MRYGYTLETDADDPDLAGYYGDPYYESDTALFGGLKKRVRRAARRVSRVAKRATNTTVNVATLGQRKHIKQGLRRLSRSPVWNIAQTGASFIPGVGSAVSSGMAMAAAYGRGQSLKSAVLSAGRAALPGGPAAKAAFDIGVGLARGKRIDQAALAAARAQVPGGALGKAGFDAGMGLALQGQAPNARNVMLRELSRRMPPDARRAFDQSVRAARVVNQTRQLKRRGFKVFPSLNQGAQRVARIVQTRKAHRRMPLSFLARKANASPYEAKQAFAGFLNRGNRTKLYQPMDIGDLETFEECMTRCGHDVNKVLPAEVKMPVTRDEGDLSVDCPRVRIQRDTMLKLMRHGRPTIRQAILAHGLLPIVANDTGELQGDVWTIRSGDIPYKVALTVTGDANRWRQLPSANPGMQIKTIGGVTQLVPWAVGQRVKLPPSWLGNAGPAVPPPVPAPPTPAPPVPTAPPSLGSLAVPGQVYTDGSGKRRYFVMAGDFPSKIAKEFTGDAGRWKQLIAANPSKARAADGNFKTLVAGERLLWPAGWPTTRGGSVEPPPPPVPAPPIVEPPEPSTPEPKKPPGPPATPERPIALVESYLAFFYQQHAAAVPVQLAPLYGFLPADLDGTWDARATDAMRGFQRWLNGLSGIYKGIKRSMGELPTNGQPDPQSVAALESVVKKDLDDLGLESLPQTPGLPKPPPVPPAPPINPPIQPPPAPPAGGYAKKTGGGGNAAPMILALLAAALLGGS